MFRYADPKFVDKRVRGGFGSGEALVDELVDKTDDAGRPIPTDHRLLVNEPEWVRLLAVGRRDGSTISPLLRQAWDGELLQVRSRVATAVADEAHVALIGHITVEELKAKLSQTEQANGYANRHLFVLVRPARQLPSGGNFDDERASLLGAELKRALARARRVGVMHRTASAEERWAEVYSVMFHDEPGGLLGVIIARDQPQVLRLSVAYALMDGVDAIDLPHLEAAWAVWRYCRRSAEFIFGSALGDPEEDRLFVAIRAAGAEDSTAPSRTPLSGTTAVQSASESDWSGAGSSSRSTSTPVASVGQSAACVSTWEAGKAVERPTTEERAGFPRLQRFPRNWVALGCAGPTARRGSPAPHRQC